MFDSDEVRAIDSVVEGSMEPWLMKQEEWSMYVTHTQDNLISATGKKECCETIYLHRLGKVRNPRH